MKNNKFIIAAVIVLVALAGYGVSILTGVRPNVPDAFASSVGPDSFFPCETHNGVQTCFSRVAAVLGTTTPCSIKSPSATSTLVMAIAQFRPASSTATTVHMAKSTSFNATTTLLTSASFGAGAFGTLVATSTVGLDQAPTFAPNTFLNVGVFGGQGGVAFGLTGAGVCQATFQVI